MAEHKRIVTKEAAKYKRDQFKKKSLGVHLDQNTIDLINIQIINKRRSEVSFYVTTGSPDAAFVNFTCFNHSSNKYRNKKFIGGDLLTLISLSRSEKTSKTIFNFVKDCDVDGNATDRIEIQYGQVMDNLVGFEGAFIALLSEVDGDLGDIEHLGDIAKKVEEIKISELGKKMKQFEIYDHLNTDIKCGSW